MPKVHEFLLLGPQKYLESKTALPIITTMNGYSWMI